MNNFEKIALYVLGILLVVGIFFIGFEMRKVNDKLYEIDVKMSNINSSLQ